MTDQSQSWKTGSADPPRPANSTNPFVFAALHVMQTRYSEENSVRPSVCLSVRLSVRLSDRHSTRDPWQNGREICPDFYTIRKNVSLF